MPPAPSPNFSFLAHHDQRLVALGTLAERYFADDPNTCLIKLRQFGEILAQRAAARLGLLLAPEDTQVTLINRLHDRGALDATTRLLGGDAATGGETGTGGGAAAAASMNDGTPGGLAGASGGGGAGASGVGA
jgi:type I restriction enzyme R subunit